MDELLKYIPEPKPALELPPPKWWHRTYRVVLLFIVALAAMFAGIYMLFLSAPESFPEGTIFQVPQGQTLSGLAHALEEKGVVRSEFLAKAFIKLFAPRRGPAAGDYEMHGKQSLVRIAFRMANGSYDLALERVTVPEGLTNAEIAGLFAKNRKFYAFDTAEFLKLAQSHQGYLFPDTYLFLPNVTADEAVKVMLETYDRRIESVKDEIAKSKRSEKDIILMAAIIEKEASMDKEEREMVSGILWKRLDEGMMLQVDADLDTYKQRGLSKAPIANPGIATILAAAQPKASPFYFYLHGRDGKIRYAVSLEQHVLNTQLYLR